MTWFDAAAVVLVVLLAADGAVNGLAWSGLETALLAGSAAAARGLRPALEPYVRKVAELSPEDVAGTAHAAAFAAAALLSAGALVLVHPATRSWRFRHDRWWGGTWGAVNGALASLVLFSLALWPTPRACEDSIAASRLVPALGAAHDAGLSPLLPDWTAERLAQVRRS